MDILICSKLFLPANEIGAVRPTNFAKYLDEMGHRITVITGVAKSILPQQPLNDSVKIETVNHSDMALKLISRVEHTVKSRKSQMAQTPSKYQKRQTIINRFYRKIKTFRLQVYHIYLEIDWFFQAKNVINKKSANSGYDIVLSSFGPLGSHLIARYVKKQKLANFWIADLRDNMHSEEYSKVINSIYVYFEKEMMKKADAITVISNGQRSMLQNAVGKKKFKNEKIFVVHNGYQSKIVVVPGKNNSKILKIAYTGSLYAGKRDMSLLFEAIRDLITAGKIETGKIEIHYAGTSSAVLLNQAHSFGIPEIVHDYGYISRTQSVTLQSSSDILVVLSWNTKKEQGILTGKFLEYFQVYKPILAITSGNLRDAELTEMVENMNLGIGCEYIKRDIDLVRLKNYILAQYNNKIMGLPVAYTPDTAAMETFHYQKISQKLEKICTGLIANH
jgi:hypothetical protein